MKKQSFIKINAAKFSPKVLLCRFFASGMSHAKGVKLKERIVYDYELEYFSQSNGAMITEGCEAPVSKGDIIFRRPGQHVQGIMPYESYIICFDLLGNMDRDRSTYNLNYNNQIQPNYSNEVLDLIPPMYHPGDSQKYLKLFESAITNYINISEGSEILLKAIVLNIIYEIYSDIKNSFSNIHSPHYKAIADTINFMKNNTDKKISLKQLSDHSNLSPNYFHSIFTKQTGIAPNEYFIRLRLDKSKELLAKTSLTIYDIALQCGFENTPYFSYIFNQRFKISPSEFRRLNCGYFSFK